MCGRFVQLPIHRPPWPELAAGLLGMPERYNVAPTQRPSMLLLTDDTLTLQPMRWGLLPFWCKKLGDGAKAINARLETVATKPTFRDAWKTRRGVVPMAGYYEWQARPDGKQPYFLTRADGEPLWAAALWERPHTLQPEGELGSMTILTTEARDTAGEIHDRMPVFLDESIVEAWMREPTDAALNLLQQSPLPSVFIREVSRRVNTPRCDDANLLDTAEANLTP